MLNGFAPSDTLIEVTKSYTPAEEPQFALAEGLRHLKLKYTSKKKMKKRDKDGEDDDRNLRN